MSFQVSDCQLYEQRVQRSPSHDMKLGIVYSADTQYFRSGDTGNGVPGSSADPPAPRREDRLLGELRIGQEHAALEHEVRESRSRHR